MAKRSQARRNSHNNTNHNSYTEDSHHRSTRHRSSRRQRDDGKIVEITSRSHQIETAYAPPRSPQPLHAKTQAQQQYINAIKNHALTFGIGPAGTGKSYCAGALAAEALESGRIERIILTRPAVEAGGQLGYLPGELDEKFAVYIDAFRDILHERPGRGGVGYCLRQGRIGAARRAFLRGKTFDNNPFVILDAAQNTTPAQMKMFLTRIGENCKVVVNGDIRQSDVRGANGLQDAIARVRGLPDVFVHEFGREDIVRSGL